MSAFPNALKVLFPENTLEYLITDIYTKCGIFTFNFCLFLVFASSLTEAYGLHSNQMFKNERVRLTSLCCFSIQLSNDIDHEQWPTFLSY